MFFNKKDDEADFCESYKSQVLGTNGIEKRTSIFGTILNVLTIFILLVIVIAISIYGYNYFMQQQQQEVEDLPFPPVSIQISDEDLVVEDEDASLESALNLKVEEN